MKLTATFTGQIPEYYDRFMGPAWFDGFAQDLAGRVPRKPGGDVLEIACGTGLVTKRLRERLDASVALVATDLNEPMLDYARRKHASLGGIEWQKADAMKLPFEDGRFAAAACGFGIMFMPEPAVALRECRRVLKGGGRLFFNVWDRIEANPTALANAETIEGMFPGDPEVRFRVPFEMSDAGLLRELMRAARFRDTTIETKRVPIESPSALELARGQILGSPRSLLLERKGANLDDAIERVAAALARIGGEKPYRSTASAIVVEAAAV